MKLLIVVALFAALTALLYLPAGADNDGVVDVSVTPKLIAISVNPTSLDYLTVEVDTNDARPDPDGFTITNTGTVNVDLYISGDDTYNSDDSLGWSLDTAPGVEKYAHRFSINPTPTLADFNPLTKLPAVFLSGVIPTGDAEVKLSLGTPTQTAHLGQQTTTVTVLATDVGVAP
jgi:hypothetical protein